MPIQSSGTISLTDIVNEFGGSVPHSLSEYYRGGGAVPSSASSVPASGAISLNDFYSAANAIGLTIDSETTNYQTSTAFGSNWAANVPKTLTINSGVTVGSENANAALIIDSGMGGTLIVHNSGSIQGSGGEGSESGTGGAGGPAVQANQNGNVTFNNNVGGEVYAGGGGGGVGGTGGVGGAGGTGGAGGNGKYLVTYHTGTINFENRYQCSGYCCDRPGVGAIGTYFSTIAQTSCNGPTNGDGSYINHSSDQFVDSQSTRGRFRYYRASFVLSFGANATGGSGGSGGGGGAGGVGGAGGKGKGYKQTRTDGKTGGNAAPGSAGSGGASPNHPNAGYGGDGGNGGIGGAGGAGGNGGTWGTAGGTGSTGSSGSSGTAGTTGGTGFNMGSKAGTTAQNTGSAGNGGSSGNSGSSGSAGGASGAYVVNRGYITFNNSGSVAGT